jgi:hypothetical protein
MSSVVQVIYKYLYQKEREKERMENLKHDNYVLLSA